MKANKEDIVTCDLNDALNAMEAEEALHATATALKRAVALIE
jgi:3-hydroxy-3-methylglutaryl CoA synthase